MEKTAAQTNLFDSEEFKPLKTRDEYSLYFNQLSLVFEKLIEVFMWKTNQSLQSGKGKKQSIGRADAINYEALTIQNFLARILFTIDVFRKKYTYNSDHTLKVDLTDSGFPSFAEISNITTDLQRKANRMPGLADLDFLKQEMLDYMFKFKAEPEKLLLKACERSYHEMLDPEKLFMAFTPY